MHMNEIFTIQLNRFYDLGRCEIFIFPQKNDAPLGIWSLICVLTGEEKNIL